MRSRLPVTAAILAALGTGSCSADCDCLVPATAVIYGHVRTSTGAALAGATVQGFVADPSSACSLADVPSGLAQTNAAGGYRVALAQGAASDSACLFVQARPAPGGSSATLVGPLRISLRYDPPFDSLSVDITIAP